MGARGNAAQRAAYSLGLLPHVGLPGAVLPGSLCAALFPAIIGSRFPGALYLSQTLKFRRPALVRPFKGLCSGM